MSTVRILFIEDSREDLILMTRALKQSGLIFESEQVLTLAALDQALLRPWDILLSDYNLLGFDASDVLKLIREKKIDTPAIVVSGAVREEDAADLMRLGARDFVRKDNATRLVPAIHRELREAEERRARQLAERALESNQEFTSKILLSTEDSILVLDEAGVILSDVFGMSRHTFADVDAIGRNFEALWSRPGDRASAALAISDASKGQAGKFVGQRGGAWWNVVITLISSSQNHGSNQLLVVARDVTAEKRTQDAVKRQAAELQSALLLAESANQMKSAFLANMSHEIRTPVGAMMGFAELLTDGALSAEDRTGFALVVKRNGESLLRLLNEILDLSKIEAGHLDIDARVVSLRTIVHDAITSLLPRAKEKNLTIDLVLDSQVPDPLTTDPTRVLQILVNLMGNAIKFTDRGTIQLTVLAVNEDGQDFTHFCVRDSGVGITQADQLKLFKPFSQADNTLNRKSGGTGLGLALSKRLANALGGDVTIRSSEPGQGSEFLAVIQSVLTAVG